MTTNEFTSSRTETTTEERPRSCWMNKLESCCKPGSPFRFAIPVCQIKKNLSTHPQKNPDQNWRNSRSRSKNSQRSFLSSHFSHFWFLSLANSLRGLKGTIQLLQIPYLRLLFRVCFLVGSSRIEVGYFSFYSNCFLEVGQSEWYTRNLNLSEPLDLSNLTVENKWRV